MLSGDRTLASQVLLRTRTTCELAELSYERAHQLFLTTLSSECPKILYAIGAQLSKRLLDTSRKAGRLAFLDVTDRITRTLHDLCSEPEAMSHPDGTQLRISRQELERAKEAAEAANNATVTAGSTVLFTADGELEVVGVLDLQPAYAYAQGLETADGWGLHDDLVDHRRGDPARPGQPRSRGRRHFLR